MQTLEANRQLTMPDGSTFVIVDSDSSNDGSEIVFEITMAPGAMGPPRHSHPAQDESWTVQTGELSVLVDGQWRTLGAGEALTIPPGVVHTLANRSATTVRFHDAHRPALDFRGVHRGSRPAHARWEADRADDRPHNDLRRHGPRRAPPNAAQRHRRPASCRIRARGARNAARLPRPAMISPGPYERKEGNPNVRRSVVRFRLGDGRRAWHSRGCHRGVGRRSGSPRVPRRDNVENPLPVDPDTLYVLGSVTKPPH